MKPWKTLSRETLLTFSKFLSVEKHTVELPDGQVIDDWPWLVTPDYVNVAAITPDEKFLCFRQTKYSVKDTTLAPAWRTVHHTQTLTLHAPQPLRRST